jgi:hypothetical protein
MNKLECRLVDVAIELAVAKRALQRVKRDRKKEKAKRRDNADKEIDTLKAGIKVSKRELDALAGQLAHRAGLL